MRCGSGVGVGLDEGYLQGLFTRVYDREDCQGVKEWHEPLPERRLEDIATRSIPNIKRDKS